MKRHVYICMFKQETNSFCPDNMGMDYFRNSMLEGDELIGSANKVPQTVRGMLDVLKEHECQPHGGIGMAAQGGGPVSEDVVRLFLERALAGLHAVERIDGVLLYFHGATLSTGSDDVCGDLTEAFRNAVGQQIPILIACDMHANISPKTMAHADGVCGYVTYPHADFYETGCRAARLLCGMLDGIQPKAAWVSIPMIAPASGYTTDEPQLKALMAQGADLVARGRILDFSVFQAQPWLDVPGMATTVVAVAREEAAAKDAARMLAKGEFALRRVLQGSDVISVAEGVQLALDNPQDKPIILADSADSNGAGSKGDSAEPLLALLPHRDVLRAAITVADPAAVRKAFELGVGGKADFELGGTLAPRLSKPVQVKDAVVKSLHTGEYIAAGPAEKGMLFRIGPCAVLQAGQIQILVTRNGQTQRDIQLLRGFGIEPASCRLVCIKACSSFKASYAAVSAAAYTVDTPGSSRHDLTQLPYARRPKPLFPFEEITEADISAPICFR